MAYVTVPKDLTHVKSKVLFGLTKRQLVCFGGALLTGGPLYFLTRDYLSNSAAALLMIFAMLPGLLFALFERHGQPLEVVIQQMIQCC
ncbi:PrgI family protein, partial [Faecalibacterium prausnitzii]